METVRWLFGIKSQHPIVDGDEIYPVHGIDSADVLRPLILGWTMRFNDVLDADKLHEALCRLINIGDWKKLGGRMRVGKSGRLEFHVPVPFTAARPPVTYSHQTFNIKIAEHELAGKLPVAGAKAQVFAGPHDFLGLTTGPDAPQTLEDYLSRDVPLLSLHIISFDDATVIGLAWPHAVTDAMGRHAIMSSWSLILAGKEAEAPPFLGAREDVLYKAADPGFGEHKPFVLEPTRLFGVKMLMFGLRFLKDMLFVPATDSRTAYIPKRVIDNLRAQMKQEIAEKNGAVAGDAWISEGDILTAWFAQKAALSNPGARPMIIGGLFDLRSRLPETVSRDGVYVQNMVLLTFTTVSAELYKGPVSGIALEHRRCLKEQFPPEQVLGHLRELRRNWDRGSYRNPVYGPSDGWLFTLSNWTKADFVHAIQFGPAVVKQGESDDTRKNPLGTMVYHHSTLLRKSRLSRNSMGIPGKDHEGNYWITGYLSPGAWELVEQGLADIESN
ncbi:unnamed protein product [Clonostachys rosea f. rosea IK726]|uniref:Uncharacterized protein n=1 Tax=Clonostachys rosea f. rosea IK726 TaxID=1349383 RepID=A0ACA9UJL4_BIOOC|nr:unnamed protein product [Clonostachys rosea f. rosea IK726]